MSERCEYRVVWQREGLRRATKLYQTRKAAERWAFLVQGRMAEVTGDDPEDYGCCDGYMCGCSGKTNRELWAERAAGIPPLIAGPEIESREVGEWAPAASPPSQDNTPETTSTGRGGGGEREAAES